MRLSTRLTIAMVTLVLITAGAIGTLIYYNVLAVALPRILNRLDIHARMLALDLESSRRGARFFVQGFRQAAALQGMVRARAAGGVDPEDGVTESKWAGRLAARFAADIQPRPDYLQIRIINADGRELIRVDRSGPDGTVRIVPEAELEAKDQISYFQETIKLTDSQIYVSPVDYRRAHGIMERPPVPVLRIAGRLDMPNGQLFGIMVVNIDLRSIFDRIRSAALTDAHVYLVNEHGNYLINPDRAKEFGFEFGTPMRIQDDFPEFGRILPATDSGPRVIQDRDGTRFAAGFQSVQLAGGPVLSVIETMPYEIAIAAATAVRNFTLVGGTAATLVGMLLAALVARSLSRPLTEMTAAVAAFSRDQTIDVPTGASGEMAVLAKAFATMGVDVREKTRLLKREVEERKLVEEKFRLAVEASPSGLIMTDGKGKIVLVNAESERLFGYKREELIGQPVEMLVTPALRTGHARDFAAFAAEPEARDMAAGRDLFGFHKDGTEVPVEIHLNPINTPNGLMVLSVILDVSKRKKTEAQLNSLAARERLLIAAVESSDDAIVTKTLDGVITSWNSGAERLFGYAAEETIGRSIEILIPSHLHGEVRTVLDKIGRGERIQHYETVRITKDGRLIDVALSISPVRSAAGTIVGAAKVCRDITDKKRAAQSLAESEQMGRDIIASALDGFVQLNELEEVIEWNPRAEAIFGWSRQEALGKCVTDLYLPSSQQTPHRTMIARLKTEYRGIRGERFEFDARHKDGRELKVEVALTALRRRDGYVFNGFVRDLTQQIAAEEQLRQAQKMEAVGQLTGGIAHDFNNMLTVITGSVDILADAVADKPRLASIVTLISEAAERGAELTGHLLAFSRKQPLQSKPTHVNALMAEVTKLLRPTLGAQIEIVSKLQGEVWTALIDPTQLTTAIINLGVNARDAMPKGGKLTLETSNVLLDQSYAAVNGDLQPGQYVMIAVSDTGSGIPEPIRTRVFEPFFSTKEVGKGTGLGLSMVYGFVKQSGGHIQIYSEVGHGTTIKLYFPRVEAKVAEDLNPASAKLVDGGSETILIVEDDPMVRKYACQQIKDLGYKTLSATNAIEALALIDNGVEFDLLFSDIIMPGLMNGRQLADEAARRRPGLKVLFTSGFTENALHHHGRLDPGVLLLAKPYRLYDLARMLRTALDQKSRYSSYSTNLRAAAH